MSDEEVHARTSILQEAGDEWFLVVQSDRVDAEITKHFLGVLVLVGVGQLVISESDAPAKRVA